MKRGLKNGFLRGDGEEQRGSRKVGKSRRNGLKHQGKYRESQKCEGVYHQVTLSSVYRQTLQHMAQGRRSYRRNGAIRKQWENAMR